MAKCNSLYIDVDGLMQALIDSAVQAMEDVEVNALEAQAREISEGSESRIKWRTEALGILREVERSVAYEKISMEFGVDLASVSGDLLNRITVALYGNQEGGNIHSKPGSDVYGKGMDGKHKSNAVSQYDIPQFDHPQSYNADKMFQNVWKLTKPIFNNAISAMWKSINFADFVHVTGG